jgi:hypothetical protein
MIAQPPLMDLTAIVMVVVSSVPVTRAFFPAKGLAAFWSLSR